MPTRREFVAGSAAAAGVLLAAPSALAANASAAGAQKPLPAAGPPPSVDEHPVVTLRALFVPTGTEPALLFRAVAS